MVTVDTPVTFHVNSLGHCSRVHAFDSLRDAALYTHTHRAASGVFERHRRAIVPKSRRAAGIGACAAARQSTPAHATDVEVRHTADNAAEV